jgi:hypothetical protein
VLAAAPPAAAIGPPDPACGWTAEIAWTSGSDSSVFRVIARDGGGKPVTLAESAPVEWPPTGPESIQAMSAAAEALIAQVDAAGWRPLPPGSTWYAKRFAWDPPTEWCCEIEWVAGYRRSRFHAVVRAADGTRGRVIAESAAFKWTMNEPPDPRSAGQLAEVGRMTAALLAAGWEPVGRGARWYSARCVWRGAAPESLRLG